MHGLRRTYPRLEHRFGHTRWNSYVTWVMWNLASFCLETRLCQCKIGAWLELDIPLSQKLFWTYLMVPLGDEAQVEACFGSFEDSANLDAR
jgi:hypothetical protein